MQVSAASHFVPVFPTSLFPSNTCKFETNKESPEVPYRSSSSIPATLSYNVPLKHRSHILKASKILHSQPILPESCAKQGTEERAVCMPLFQIFLMKAKKDAVDMKLLQFYFLFRIKHQTFTAQFSRSLPLFC